MFLKHKNINVIFNPRCMSFVFSSHDAWYMSAPLPTAVKCQIYVKLFFFPYILNFFCLWFSRLLFQFADCSSIFVMHDHCASLFAWMLIKSWVAISFTVYFVWVWTKRCIKCHFLSLTAIICRKIYLRLIKQSCLNCSVKDVSCRYVLYAYVMSSITLTTATLQ